MARFTLPRDLYHGENAIDALKDFVGKKAIVCVGGGSPIDAAKAQTQESQHRKKWKHC